MYHIRFTPYDISGYTFDFLETYSSYIVCYEDKTKSGEPTEPHYHIGIWSDLKDKSIRDDIKTHLKIPATGRGKNNKYYALISGWQDVSYLVKYNNIVKMKDVPDLLTLVAEGKEKHLKATPPPEGRQPPQAAKRVCVDKEIMIALMEFMYAKKRNGGYSREDLAAHACTLVRSHGKGINIFKIREYVHGVLWDDEEEGRSWVLNKISGLL